MGSLWLPEAPHIDPKSSGLLDALTQISFLLEEWRKASLLWHSPAQHQPVTNTH